MTAQLTFVESENISKTCCKSCLFCLKDNIVDEDLDNGHEDCALEQAENGFPEALYCFPVTEWTKGLGRKDGKRGYWTI